MNSKLHIEGGQKERSPSDLLNLRGKQQCFLLSQNSSKGFTFASCPR